MPVVHWFRRDLRLADNPALVAAVREARDVDDEVVALYVLDPDLWRSSGLPRLAYLAATLAALHDACDGRLVVRHGRAGDVVPALAREVGLSPVDLARSPVTGGTGNIEYLWWLRVPPDGMMDWGRPPAELEARRRELRGEEER